MSSTFSPVAAVYDRRLKSRRRYKLLLSEAMAHLSLVTGHLSLSWRGGRAVECAGLENRKAERPREFESHPLRHQMSDVRCSMFGLVISQRQTNSADKIPSTAAHTTSDK